MTIEFRYRGRKISQEDILYIRALIEQHPQESRRTLSTKLCEAWQWRQANGALRDMVCRGLLLMLDRAGQIQLPPVSYVRHNPLVNRARPEPVRIDATPIEGPLRNLQPLEFELVRRTGKEPLWNSLLEEHHYLGYGQPVGEHLKYLVLGQGRPVACLGWSSAPRHLGSRDRYIGWSAEARRRNVRFLAYNTRFLILPWVKVEHLASHILGLMALRISADWQRIYGHPIYFLETFVDPERFRGTCYRAANREPIETKSFAILGASGGWRFSVFLKMQHSPRSGFCGGCGLAQRCAGVFFRQRSCSLSFWRDVTLHPVSSIFLGRVQS